MLERRIATYDKTNFRKRLNEFLEVAKIYKQDDLNEHNIYQVLYKTEQFRNYEDYGTEGLCIVYKGVYTLRGGRIYLGQTQSSVFNEGSIVADMKDEKLYIASDTDLHFFSDCEFERVN